MLPDGWKRCALGEIAQIASGGTPDRSEASYWGGNIPWVTTGEIQFNTITDTAEKITEIGLKKSSAKLFPPGTLLMAMYGQGKTRGQVAKLGIEAATNQNSAAILLNNDQDADYYFHYLSWKYESLRAYGHSSGISHLNAGLLKQISVPVAPQREQKRIAQLLTNWDQAIATTERLLANSRKQKQALVNVLLDERSDANNLQSPWQIYSLGELFTERVETSQDSLPLLSITREEGVINRDEVGRKDTSNADKSKYLRICPGDIGYNTMRMWQGVSALSRLDGIVSPAYTIVKPNDLINGQFAAHLFKSNRLVFKFYRHSQGLVSDTWNLKFPHFAKIKVRIPERAEQESIVKVLTITDEAIKALECQVEMFREEKRALMADLLTGKRRVHLDGKETSLP